MNSSLFVPHRTQRSGPKSQHTPRPTIHCCACRLPCGRRNLWLAEHGAELVDDSGRSLTSGDPSDRTRSGTVRQNRLADLVSIEFPADVRVGAGCAAKQRRDAKKAFYLGNVALWYSKGTFLSDRGRIASASVHFVPLLGERLTGFALMRHPEIAFE